MQSIIQPGSMVESATHAGQDAAQIPRWNHQEAAGLANTEIDRFLDLLETLDESDLEKPTYCTLWNVKQVAAHESSQLDGTSSFANFRRMTSKEVTGAYRDAGMSMLDALNQAGVDSREHLSLAEIIAEMRANKPRSIAWRDSLPWIVRAIRLPIPELGGIKPIGYLTDVIYTRDMWMHRVDICRATGRSFMQTTDHDGRIVALVVRDLADELRRLLSKQSITLVLTGECGGAWRMGKNPAPAATLNMDALDFNVLASGRMTPDEFRAQSLVTISGDTVLANRVLDHITVPY